MSAFEIAGRPIGGDAPLYVIAEAGVNHDGDPDAALALVDAAAAAGADAVKFQTFDPAALVSADAPQAEYQRERAPAEGQLAMLEKLRLGDEHLERLMRRAHERGIAFLSTPFDEGSAELLDRLGVPAFKVGSGDLSNLPLLAALARRGKPMIVSTGMATMDEVGEAVDTVHAGGVRDLALLHCVSSYPTPPEQANLRAMDTLRDAHPDAVIGYSDHCEGLTVSLAAVARGAKVLERHLTLDRTLPGPDHALSLEPAELEQLVQRARETEAALGSGAKQPQPAEQDVMAVARRSITAARALNAGEVLAERDLALRRPAGGLPPARLPELVGRTVARDVPEGAQLREEDLS